MKKKAISMILVFGLFIFINIISAGADKAIVSPNLEEAVKYELGIEHDEKISITPQQLAELRKLDAAWWGIADLRGIEHAVNLNELYLEGNQLEDISLLSDLSSLEIVVLADNKIKDITPLNHLKHISLLDLSRNEIEDISPLSNLAFTGYENGLDLAFNKIKTIEPLATVTVSGKPDYFYVNLSFNELTSLHGIGNLKELTELKADNNRLRDVSGLENLSNLRYISVQNNSLENFPNLDLFPELQTLILANNRITNIEFLSNVQSGYIDLSNNNISNIKPLENFQEGTVILTGNPLDPSAANIIQTLFKRGVHIKFDEEILDFDEYRIFGPDRYRTAVAISQYGWREKETDTVLIARGDSFPDALAGVPFAYALNAPILLTGNTVDQYTMQEIKRLGAKTVQILGGEVAVSNDVVKQLKNTGLEVNRIAGGGRYETAVKIAEHLFKESAITDTAILAFGQNFPDALAAAPYAAENGFPILLTGSDKLPYATKKFIKENYIKKVIIVGGEKVITPTIKKELEKEGIIEITRIKGSNRYDTAAKMITELNQNPSKVFLANGNNFPDALTGAVLAAKENAPLLLLEKDSVPNATRDIFVKHGITDFSVFGGEAAVSNKVIFEISMIN